MTERLPMFMDWMDWQNYYFANGYTTKATYRFNAIHINPNVILHRRSKSNPEGEKNAGGVKIPDFKLYYRPTVTKIARHCTKPDTKEQWNRRPRNKCMWL
jgi:hypothetical protein